MERELKSTSQTLKKFVFFAVIILLCLAGIFWGVSSIYQIHTQYTAAALTAGEIGIYSQSLAGYANKLTTAQNDEAYQKIIVKLKSLIRNMEFKHWSLFKGNPRLSADNRFAAKIKAIYYAGPHHTVIHIRNFLDHANQLVSVPYREINPGNTHLNYLKSSVKGNLIQAISNTIRTFRHESERRVSSIILILIGGMVLMAVASSIGYTILFQSEKPYVYIPCQRKARSVSTVLNEFMDHAYTEEQIVKM